MFINNSATVYGGGVFALYCTLAFNGNGVFMGNSGGQCGGAMSAQSSTLNVNSGVH